MIIKILSLVLLFIVWLSFPWDKSTTNVIGARYNDEIFKQIRRCEKLEFLIAFTCCYLVPCFYISRLLINSCKRLTISIEVYLIMNAVTSESLQRLKCWILSFHPYFMRLCIVYYCHDFGISININLDICFSYIFWHCKRSLLQSRAFLLQHY